MKLVFIQYLMGKQSYKLLPKKWNF